MTTPKIEPPETALSVIRGLHAAGHEAWLVGGCVRDGFLERAVGDWDITTSAQPEAVMSAFERTVPTGLQHGTVTVVVEGEPVEVTTYRVEGGYTDGRRPDEIAFTSNLEEDLQRRDFTVNAMAWDPIRDVVVDPFHGQADLKAGCIRAVGRALDRLTEDGLRSMRAVRFASVLGFSIEPETWAAIPQTMGTFAKVSVERIQVELTKILVGPHPRRGLRLLSESGLLEAFLPALVAAPGHQAAFDAVGEVGPQLPQRLAIMLSPLGREASAALEHLRYSNAVRRRVQHLLSWQSLDWRASEPVSVRRAVSALVSVAGDVEVVDEALAVHRALPYPGAGVVEAFASRVDAVGAREGPHRTRDLALDGKSVMTRLSIPPSRKLGLILDALLLRAWADPSLNTPEGLGAILTEVAREIE